LAAWVTEPRLARLATQGRGQAGSEVESFYPRTRAFSQSTLALSSGL
jgi:hypothetical protein